MNKLKPIAYVYDMNTHYPVYNANDLMEHNPIFMAGQIILVSYDGQINANTRLKIANGKSPYNDLMFIESNFIIQNMINQTKISIEFSVTEALKVRSVCKTALTNALNKLDGCTDDADVVSIKKEIETLSEIVDKMKKSINYIYGKK